MDWGSLGELEDDHERLSLPIACSETCQRVRQGSECMQSGLGWTRVD